jgi:hypothetical protein
MRTAIFVVFDGRSVQNAADGGIACDQKFAVPYSDFVVHLVNLSFSKIRFSNSDSVMVKMSLYRLPM